MKSDCIVIGVAGGTGSGKSTFTNRIKSEFGDEIAVVYHDNYYKCRDGVSFEDRKKINYDHPDALETSLLISHIKALKKVRLWSAQYMTLPSITVPKILC